VGLIIFGSFIGLVLIVFLTLWILSRGSIAPFIDENGNAVNGSISEIVRTEIGGIEQGIIIRGRSVENPVLLFLHGGPGTPAFTVSDALSLRHTEDYFVVAYWEQRGSGMSYHSAETSRSITVEQLVSDTAEVANYLRERFGQDRIYLMGHSWGSFPGMQTIAAYPELFLAYLGVAQVAYKFESEILAHTHMAARLAENGDRQNLQRLSEYTLNTYDDITTNRLMFRSSVLNSLGNGVIHEPFSMFRVLLWPFLTAREYTLSDKFGFAMGNLHALASPAQVTLVRTNLMEEIVAVDVPVFFFHGVHDKQVNYELARQYFDILQAPSKQFFSFENSAHSPAMEEPDMFLEFVIRYILGFASAANK